ncbi:MAG: GntR family transcriptional regulator [Anaerolineae bacterium]|nr:GntR family transcriptional regulator [Anaerolineae bacterium]
MRFDIQLDSPVALHMQLVQQLRAKIESGEWGPGARIPSEIELAKENGISRGTVRQAMVRLHTDGLLERAPGKGTYVANRTLVSNMLIGVILPYERDMLNLEILVGSEKAARQEGYHVIYSQTHDDLQIQTHDIQLMREKGVAGLVIFPASDIAYDETIARLYGEGFPFVLVDRYFPPLATDYVVVDNFGGAYDATQHLIALGHRRIGFLSPGSLDTTSIRDRFEGYRQALADHNLDYDETLFHRYQGLMQTDKNLASLRSMLCQADRPSAFFAVTDLLAIRLLEAAQREHLDVPDDLSVVGFDDIQQASLISVPLTTVAQPRIEIGIRAVEVLIERLHGHHEQPKQIVLPTRLVVRLSSGKARTRP